MTTPEQSEGDRSRDELLAGEYVLGVLSLADRERVAARIARDRVFAAIVARWQDNLASFNDDYDEVRPPPGVYSKIETRLFPHKTFAQELVATGRWWNSLLLWRGVALGSLAVLITYVSLDTGWIGGGPQSRPLVAELAGEGNSISLVAAYDVADGRLRVTPVAAGAADQHSLELWLVPGGDDPAISLGVLPQTGEGSVEIPANLRPRLGEGVTLAVSLEPFGGSPTGQATGPVIAVGQTRRSN
ncbi:anti-sigma factor [Neorhizobium alkalisoli]|uniref:anti-sigma factor n=1 Tax=Neorhizobium alkalisoli TaxID=528178 RepID=UPI000CFA2F3B|nr:anti-sigma factor [Neorhizobium alkalisoli]